MPEIKFGSGCLLEILPLFKEDNRFLFVACTIKESIFGGLPTITINAKTSKDLIDVSEEITGSLTNADAVKTTFEGYVYAVSTALDKCTIKIMCVRPDFIKKERVNKFNSMNEAIKGLYQGKIISNTESDLMNDMLIFQKDISNYNLIKKCLAGYKKNTIYGFSIGGLRINDLSNWKPKKTVVARLNIQPVDATKLTDPKLYHKDTEFIDYSDGKDSDHKIVKFYDQHVPVNSEYEDFVANIQYNSRFMTMKNITNYKTRELFDLDITDAVEVEDDQKRTKKCFVSSRIINFDYNKMQVDYTIQSIDPI